MPRYFFNMMEGGSQNLVRDIDGILLADASKAREEAIGLAQDITSHRLAESMKTWSSSPTRAAPRFLPSPCPRSAAASLTRRARSAMPSAVALPSLHPGSVMAPSSGS